FFGYQSNSQRNISSSQPFSQHHYIRNYSFVFRCKHSTGSAESGHYFVNNQQGIRPVAPFANGSECPIRPQTHPRSPLDKRLNHNGSSLCYFGRRERFQRPNIWNLHYRKVPASRSDLEHGHRTQTRRTGRIAMIAVPECNKLMPSRMPQPPILIHDSQSGLDSRRPVVREENSAQGVIWEKSSDRLRELDGRGVRAAEK